MLLNGLNCIRKIQFDLENLICSRYRANPSFLLGIKILFQKITEECVFLENSILKQFKDIEYQISKQDFVLSEKSKFSEKLSELSAFQAQFNILIEIQAEIEKKLRKKKWFSDKLELVLTIPCLSLKPELANRPKSQLRKPKRKIGNEIGTMSLNESKDSEKVISSPNFVTEYNPKKKMEKFRNEPSEVLEIAEIEANAFSQKINSDITPYKQTIHQQTNTIINKQEQLSQENFPAKHVEMNIPFSSLSLNNDFTQETNITSVLFDCSQTDTTLILEENIGSQITESNDTQNISLSQELLPMENLFKTKTIPENEYSLTTQKEKIDDKPLFLSKIPEKYKFNISNPSCDGKHPVKLTSKLSQATDKTKCVLHAPNNTSKNLQTPLNHIKSFHKQSSILKYVSPPRNLFVNLKKSSDCKSLTHKNTDFSREDHQTKANLFGKFNGSSTNPHVDRKLLNKPFYSMNILMIQREEIIYDFPDSFWTDDEFPAVVISQLERDLDYS